MTMIPIQIRPSNCDSLGHVNNSAYVAYLEYALAELMNRQGLAADWIERGPYRWAMGDLAIEYRLASSFGDRLAAHVWLAEANVTQPVFGCEIVRHDGENRQVVLRSRSSWQRLAKRTGQPVALPDSLIDALANETGALPRAFKAPDETGQVRHYQWRSQVERAEVGLGGQVHPHVIFQWIEESVFSASAAGGWPIERCLASDFVVLQMRHDTNIFSLPKLGESIEITSRLVDVRRLRGSWQNEIRRRSDGRLMVNDYSTGVFLNLAGRLTSAPPGMMEALQTPV